MTAAGRITFTEHVGDQGGGAVVTMHGGHVRWKWARIDLDRALVVIGALGVLAAVAIALWGPV